MNFSFWNIIHDDIENLYASSCNKRIVHQANDVILRASYRHLHVHSIDCEARRYVLNVKESCRVCTCQKGKIYSIRMSLSAIVGGNYKWIYLQKWIVSVIRCIYVSYIGYIPLNVMKPIMVLYTCTRHRRRIRGWKFLWAKTDI